METRYFHTRTNRDWITEWNTSCAHFMKNKNEKKILRSTKRWIQFLDQHHLLDWLSAHRRSFIRILSRHLLTNISPCSIHRIRALRNFCKK